jgi:hypothetical protein
MDHGRRQQAKAPVMVLVVLPVKKLAAKIQSVLDAAEPVGELRLILHRFELALRKRIASRRGRQFGWFRATPPIERRPRYAQAAAGRCRADLRREFFDGFHGPLPL